MGRSLSQSYYSSAEYNRRERELEKEKNDRISSARRELAAKIVMALVDKIVADIVRPGPLPEERECYEMAGELRAAVPGLEELAKKIIDVEDGVE